MPIGDQLIETGDGSFIYVNVLLRVILCSYTCKIRRSLLQHYSNRLGSVFVDRSNLLW